MRIFIAAPLAEEVRRGIASRMPSDEPGWRWTRAELLHITLAFLGELEEGDLPGLRAAIDAAAHRGVDIRLRAAGLGAFPGPARARTAWVGVAGEVDELALLQADLTSELAHRGFTQEERRYTPHITVARARAPRPVPKGLRELARHEFGAWTVESVQLLESVLSPRGPTYRLRHEARLGG